jgi:hypothetical protein
VGQLIAKDEDEIAAALFHRRKTPRCRLPFQTGTAIDVFLWATRMSAIAASIASCLPQKIAKHVWV